MGEGGYTGYGNPVAVMFPAYDVSVLGCIIHLDHCLYPLIMSVGQS